MSDYQPIACARHEALELAILRGQWLHLELAEPQSGATVLLARPLDIGVADGAEWLLVRAADGGERRLRLDHIRGFEPATPAPRAADRR
jgi:transcriptional antiterminator Rof (Rho-off)